MFSKASVSTKLITAWNKSNIQNKGSTASKNTSTKIRANESVSQHIIQSRKHMYTQNITKLLLNSKKFWQDKYENSSTEVIRQGGRVYRSAVISIRICGQLKNMAVWPVWAPCDLSIAFTKERKSSAITDGRPRS